MAARGLDAIVLWGWPMMWDFYTANARYLSPIGGNAEYNVLIFPAVGEPTSIIHMPTFLSAHAERAVFANLSARVGSIEDNRLGGWYAYRASKAAQNMYTRTLAIEWARSRRNVICVALHPGTTDTDLSRPFQGNVPEGKLFSVDRTVSQLLAVIDRLQPDDSGQFFAWDGERIPW